MHAYLVGYVAPLVRCGKVPYDSREQARAAMRDHRAHAPASCVQQGAGRLQAYRCRRCGCWHLGHVGR